MPPRRHDHEAGSSSSAPPAPETDPALLAILERMRQDQARQDEFQRQQQAIQQQQLLMQQQLLGFMQHVVTAIGAPPPQPSP